MHSESENPEEQDLLVIVGPTAVGKTALSLSLAREFRGEVVWGIRCRCIAIWTLELPRHLGKSGRRFPII